MSVQTSCSASGAPHLHYRRGSQQFCDGGRGVVAAAASSSAVNRTSRRPPARHNNDQRQPTCCSSSSSSANPGYSTGGPEGPAVWEAEARAGGGGGGRRPSVGSGNSTSYYSSGGIPGTAHARSSLGYGSRNLSSQRLPSHQRNHSQQQQSQQQQQHQTEDYQLRCPSQRHRNPYSGGRSTHYHHQDDTDRRNQHRYRGSSRHANKPPTQYPAPNSAGSSSRRHSYAAAGQTQNVSATSSRKRKSRRSDGRTTHPLGSRDRRESCNGREDGHSSKARTTATGGVKRGRTSRKLSDEKDKSRKRKHKDSRDDAIVHFEWYNGMWLNERYRVVDSLGEGTFGRVLRCHDAATNTEVAIKVVRDVERYTSAAKIEGDILQEIRRLDPENKSMCVRLLDTFICRGKNMCLVFEKLGLSLYELLALNCYKGFYVEDIQQFAKLCLQALGFMHSIKLTHTDLKPENILLESNEWSWANAPRTHGTIRRPKRPTVKVIDFGSATFDDEYHCSIINTRQYRAPEVILDIGWETSSDVWSLGCILMELYTGVLMFKTHEHLEHLAMIERIIGPLPPRMIELAAETEGRKYISLKDRRINWPEGASTSNSIRRVKECVQLKNLTWPLHRLFADFVGFLLQIDPKDRPSPEMALRHDFFRVKLQEN